MLPQRIADLAKAVSLLPGFEDWRPNYEPDSLNSLGNWFKSQIKTRANTQEEMRSFPPHIREWVSEGELTDDTISKAVDVAMYLSHVFVRNNPSLKWDQIFGSRKFIDFGQPVLVGFRGGVPFNPVRMVLTMAYGLARKTKDERGLRDLYDIWAGMVKTQ